MLYKKHIAILLAASAITACGGGGTSGGTVGGAVVAPSGASVSDIGGQLATDELVELENAALEANLDSIFGGDNAEPVDVLDGDTVADVIARAGTGG